MLLPEHEAVVQQNQAASYMHGSGLWHLPDVMLWQLQFELGSNAPDVFRVWGTTFLHTAAACMLEEQKPVCLFSQCWHFLCTTWGGHVAYLTVIILHLVESPTFGLQDALILLSLKAGSYYSHAQVWPLMNADVLHCIRNGFALVLQKSCSSMNCAATRWLMEEQENQAGKRACSMEQAWQRDSSLQRHKIWMCTYTTQT